MLGIFCSLIPLKGSTEIDFKYSAPLRKWVLFENLARLAGLRNYPLAKAFRIQPKLIELYPTPLCITPVQAAQ